MSTEVDALVARLVQVVKLQRLRVAVAESLTCGRIVSALGAGDDAAIWLAGGIVAYTPDVKFRLLDVDDGPVITARCARQLARGAAGLFRADLTLGVTGCGGPDAEEGQPPGTVFMAAQIDGELRETSFAFDGPPGLVLDLTTRHAVEHLWETAAAPQE